MSETPSEKVREALDLEKAEAVIQVASDELAHLCHEKWAGRDGWHWEIPANPKRDTDLRIGDAIGLAKDLLDEVRRLRALESTASGLREAAIAMLTALKGDTKLRAAENSPVALWFQNVTDKAKSLQAIIDNPTPKKTSGEG